MLVEKMKCLLCGRGLHVMLSSAVKVHKLFHTLVQSFDCKFLKRDSILVLMFLFLLPDNTFSQSQTVFSGKVVDSLSGLQLAGVTISVDGSLQGTSTNTEGEFSLELAQNKATLIFSYVGYIDKKITLDKGVPALVQLNMISNSMEDVAVVAYGSQKKSSMVSSITSIDPKELKVPSSNLTTALAGRLAGVIAYQRTGEPGLDNASFFIRGVTTFGYKKDPLIMVDGVEVTATDLARLQPDDIGSFSIMRDATATALYGARGANGVILVTTKAGAEGPARITIRIENSRSSNTRDIAMADPVTYMKLHNEAVLTRDRLGILPYSSNKIDNTISNVNPYVFPANDWLGQLIKSSTNNQRMNFNANGGGKIARYYIAGTYNKDNGILQVDKRNNFNSNIALKSYQLRSNINIDMTKTTEVIVRLSGSFDDYRGPLDGGSGVYSKILRSNPVLFPAYFPSDLQPTTKHILFGNADQGTYINPYADMVKGYKDYSRSTMNAQFEVKQDLNFITKGLSARMLFNTSRYSYFDVSRFYNPFYYQSYGYDRITNTYNIGLLNENTATEYLNYNEGARDINTATYLEAAANYNKRIGRKGEFAGLLVYQRRQQLFANQGTLQKSLPYRNQGFSGRFTYSFDTRYLVEANFGYNGSERFYKTERYGFFPAAGIGWFISNEKFWENIKPVVSKLKLKATYGIVGNDAIGSADDRFFYLSDINMNNTGVGATFGENLNTFIPGITVNRYDNRNITWERSYKTNYGIELGLFQDLELQVDYFTEKRDNILMDRSAIPVSMGLTAPVRANVGEAKAFGVDASASYKKNFTNDLWLQCQGNFTFARSEFTKYEEPQYAESYKYHTGQSLNQVYGLIAERLFIDQYDVENAPKQNYGLYQAGDIKYRDVNGDGQITDLDQVPIGLPTVPEIIYGFGFSTGYKGVDFSMFFQGSARSSFWIDARATSPFITENVSGTLAQNALLKVYADNHWSEDNNNIYALWPRLSDNLIQNNIQTNTWFMRRGDFLRLKSAELGYSLSDKTMRKLHMNTCRVYLSGTNLLNISGFKLWDIEMGGNGLAYPVQRVINIGLQVGF
ncbi:TonB-dependent receptor [Niabella yanshanensis]|uniref:TonB-dependent receptor n=1 Tax=Niabella yanshanensis TaxID=577386 RepID=A0ABZ0W7V0_9BACT|nr:TonB-dependent receptor [Niabella yanshanensis]WQD39363.1 TonB-dependent receptor [Niabella yanshanensis]